MLYIIYDYFSPAYKAGGPIQSLYNMVTALDSTVDLKVICSNKDHDGTVLDVPCDEWTTYKGIPVFYSAKGYKSYKKAIPPGDSVCFINGMYSLQYNLLPAWCLHSRKILSARGMLHPGGLSQKKLKKSVYLQLSRILGLQSRCEFHASTEQEKSYIQGVFGERVKVWVIPNLPGQINYEPPREKVPGSIRISTLALISPMKNHLQLIRALSICNFQVRYDIYGSIKDHRYWRSCREAISDLPPNIQVYYHGPVSPEQAEAFLGETDICVQPSKAENFGHSLYESLAKGRPVITSHYTPWGQLENRSAGINVDPDNIEELAAAIRRFAGMDAVEFAGWCRGARDYAMSSINIEHIKSQYIEMFNGVTANK